MRGVSRVSAVSEWCEWCERGVRDLSGLGECMCEGCGWVELWVSGIHGWMDGWVGGDGEEANL